MTYIGRTIIGEGIYEGQQWITLDDGEKLYLEV